MANSSKAVLLGIPVEAGAGRRGCVMGPAAYRTAGLVEELMSLDVEVEDLGDLARGDLPEIARPLPHIKHMADIAAWTRAIFVAAKHLAEGVETPIYLGGDHSLAIGTVAGHAAAASALGRPIFVLWLDAHADFNTFETSESGNIHGMPLAFLCGEPGIELLADLPKAARINPRNVCILGLRSIDRRERSLVVEKGVLLHDMRSIDELGVAAALTPFLETVRQAGGLLHVSLDVDFLDPTIAPAVGTTVPGGATFREAHLIMEILHESGLVSSLDLVELNPFLDNRGQTTRIMVDLTASLFGRKVIQRITRSF